MADHLLGAAYQMVMEGGDGGAEVHQCSTVVRDEQHWYFLDILEEIRDNLVVVLSVMFVAVKFR